MIPADPRAATEQAIAEAFKREDFQMYEYKCACCAKPLLDFDDEWAGCTRCGCGTAEKVRMAPDDYKPVPDAPVPMEDEDE